MTTATFEPEPAAPAAPNPIDPLLTAARTLAANVRVVLPIAIVLEAIKAGAMLALQSSFGAPGETIAVGIAALLVAVEFALCTVLVLAIRDGLTIRSVRELVERTRPQLPVYLVAYFIPWGLARGSGSAPAGIAGLLGLAALAVWYFLLVAPAAAMDGHSLADACRRSKALGQLAPLATFVLAILYVWPAWELVNALTDSTIGRMPPRGDTTLEAWLTVRGIFNLAAIPLIAMSLAAYYCQLMAWSRRLPDAPEAPATPPPTQISPPDGLQRTATGGVIPPGAHFRPPAGPQG